MPPTLDLNIRDLRRSDLDALLSLYAHLHVRDDAPPDRAELRALWDRIVADDALIYLGAFDGGRLVSACNAAVIPNLTRGARPYALVENVVTHTDWRRRGIGKRVMTALLDRCWARRCYKVMLMSAIARADVHGFYESVGFDRGAKQAFVITAR